MRNNWLFNPALFMVAMILPAIAYAASAPGTAPVVEHSTVTWSAATGLGYDSNAYRAPRATYVDYAALPLGSNPTVIPKAQSGFFVPYEIKVDAAKNSSQDSRLLGTAAVDGSLYTGSGLSNANEYNVTLHGGTEHVLARQEKSEDTFYIGALFGKHKRVYVDHDSGLGKTTTKSRDISGLYNYTGFGVEAEYKHRTGKIDYGLNGKFVQNDFEDPVGAPQQDHAYYSLGADASIPVAAKTNLNLSIDHTVRDYSNRHARDLQAAFTTTLLAYTYNTAGATLRNRISTDWLLYLDYDHTQRTDNHVGYGDYSENKYGARLMYEQGRLKTRLALHHWARNYPKGFAFDVAGQPAKTYSGNDLKFKAELAQTKNTALWTELVYDIQNTTDLRYDYVRTQIMAGMSWAY